MQAAGGVGGQQPAAGISRASSPIDEADSIQATSAKTTLSGKDPPAYPAPAGMDAAIAAPGAIPVMDWKSTSRKPMASRRRPGVVAAAFVSAVTLGHLLPNR